MNYLKSFKIFSTTLLLSSVGCAGASSGPEEASLPPENVALRSEELVTSHPRTTAECSAFESQHPVAETRTLSTGETAPVPLRTCDVNLSAIFGTVDLAFARKLMNGTGYVPLEVVQPGKPTKGLARLMFADYLANDLGPYRAFFVVIDGAEANASADAKTLSWRNKASSLLPAFDPANRTFIYRMILPKEATKSIAYGRELMGIDKKAGAFDVVYDSNDSIRYGIRDENGATVLRATLRPDMSFLTLARTVGQIVGAAVGERVTPAEVRFRLHPLTLNQPISVSGEAFARIGDGPIVPQTSFIQYLPSINEASERTLDLELDASSTVGKMLLDAHFTPASFITAKHASGAWTIHD